MYGNHVQKVQTCAWWLKIWLNEKSSWIFNKRIPVKLNCFGIVKWHGFMMYSVMLAICCTSHENYYSFQFSNVGSHATCFSSPNYHHLCITYVPSPSYMLLFTQLPSSLHNLCTIHLNRFLLTSSVQSPIISLGSILGTLSLRWKLSGFYQIFNFFRHETSLYGNREWVKLVVWKYFSFKRHI